jgi:SOS-response transcriptional repressor LexA
VNQLSNRQRDLVEAVKEFQSTRGYAPSLRDLAAALSVSTTRAANLAERAAKAGALRHEPHVPRSWRLVDIAEPAS